MHILEIDDVPRPVWYSLYQGMVFNHGQARTHAKLSYHAETAFNDGAVIRVLNASTDEWLCATIEFLGAVHVSVNEWDGDEGSGHRLCEFGLGKNCFFELIDGPLANEVEPSVSSPSSSSASRHYVYAFRTRVFEVLAWHYRVSVIRQSIIDALR
jgi:hypothetical protein